VKNKGIEDYLSDESFFKAIDVDANVVEIHEGGKRSTYIGSEYGNVSYLLYKFVEEALKSKQPAFERYVTKQGRVDYKTLPLGKYIDLMVAFSNCAQGEYRHSEHVELFLDCCRKMGLIGTSWDFGRRPYGQSFINPEKLEVDEFNDVIEMMRVEAKKPKFKERVRQRERSSIRNYESGRKYQDALFADCSRLLVIRIDLHYDREQANSITEEQSLADINRFLNNRRGKPSIFSELKGYVLKREWGADKKFHFHLILYFNGARVKYDPLLGDQIGNYWEKLAGGMGTFFNCNDCKNKYKRLGIGMINHYETEMRNNLLIAMKYLAKKEQFLHATKLTSKVFRKGEYPAPRTSRAGRPRKEKHDV